MKKEKKSNHKKAIFSAVAIVVLVLLFYLVTNSITKYTGYSISSTKNEEFTDCLNSKDITLYINSENPIETLKDFKSHEYFPSIKIINCLGDIDSCETNGLQDFPTWIIDGKKFSGDISPNELSKISGCELY